MRLLTVLAIVAWAPPAFAADRDDIANLLVSQSVLNVRDVYTDDAVIVATGDGTGITGIMTPDRLVDVIAPPSTTTGGSGNTQTQIVLAGDGKSAWASFTVRIDVGTFSRDFRISDVLVKTAKGWRIAAAAWSLPVANDRANKDAKAGKLDIAALEAPAGDASLAAAFSKLARDGVDATAAARKDVVAIGSAPGERTVGGGVLANGWKAAWRGRVTTKSLVARVAPSGTTGWVAATIELDKKTYKVPFQLFCVFDKTPAGEWSLVHIHFAV